MSEFRCPICGHNRTTYRNHMEVCALCGNRVIDEATEQQRMQYDQTYRCAMDHLRAGNWNQVISMLQPLTNSRPTDVNLHKALLRAATQDFTLLELYGNNRCIAADAWFKISRLSGLNGEMITYSRRVNRYRLESLTKQKQHCFVLFICAAAFALLAASMFCITKILPAIIAIIGFCICGYNYLDNFPRDVDKELERISHQNGTENPFI